MKRKAKIQEELDSSWETYNLNIDKFAESGCTDVEPFRIALRVYGRIESLTWVLENTDENLREL